MEEAFDVEVLLNITNFELMYSMVKKRSGESS